jgi:adenosine deaminase
VLADLHRHLDGSLRPSTVSELSGRPVPRDLAFVPGMGLEAALSKFAFLLSLLQQPARVRRVANEICEDARAEGVTTLEIRFAPQLHRGASIEAIVDAAVEGAGGQAGIILCGVYGEPPEVLHELVDVAKGTRGVVGIDLAGGPASGHRFAMRDYEKEYRRAEDFGIGRTVHAGEGRPAAEIADAIELLHAQRIGHGTTLLQDARVVDLVIERGVVIEACLTSNVHTGVIASQDEHPLPLWLERGVRACICTDNTLLSSTDARAEERHAARRLDARAIQALRQTGHDAAFHRN